MPPIVFTVLQVLFLVLLYAFVARAVRWVIKDITQPAGAYGAPAAAPRRSTRRSGGTSRRAQPREVVIHFQQGPPRVLPLAETSSVTFGRHESASVVLTDPYASDFHASIHLVDGAWVVQDEGSTNGTFLNTERLIGPTQIKAGDQLSVGRTHVEVRR